MDEWRNQVLEGDAITTLARLPDKSCQMSVSSPPYWGLRDYGIPPTLWPAIDYAPMPGLPLVSIPEMECCLGLESDPWAFVGHVVQVYREAWWVLKDDGTCWVNLGDSYHGSGPSGGPGKQYTNKGSQATTIKKVEGLKPKDLIGIPWRVAFALQADGWTLRSDIIWEKPSCMPESVKDRCTRSHEYIFMLSKQERYYFDADAISEACIYPGDQGFLRAPVEGCNSETVSWRAKSQQKRKMEKVNSRTAGGDRRNKRAVWTVNTVGLSEAHFATFPSKLIEPCILAGSRPGDVVLDPFMGAWTTAITAHNLGRDFTGCEISPEYNRIGAERYRRECAQLNAFVDLARKTDRKNLLRGKVNPWRMDG